MDLGRVRDAGVNTYNAPSKKIPVKATFFRLSSWRFQIIGRGKRRIMTSPTSDSDAFETPIGVTEIQCPPGMVLSQKKAIGRHCSRLLVKAAIAHKPVKMIMPFATSLNCLVGKRCM